MWCSRPFRRWISKRCKGFRRQDQFLRSVCVRVRCVRHGGRCGARSGTAQTALPEGGLSLGPSHAIQVGTPLENILAMYRTAGSLTEVDDSILAISEGRDATTIMSNCSDLSCPRNVKFHR
ncbi:MAG: hypothetical protein ACLS37_13120 [Alistipes sp.]